MTDSYISSLLDWLDSYLNFEKLPQKNIFWLDTMEFLCGKLGQPQNSAPAFHVAGSKGKGSVSVMIASILEEAGFKSGLYTSPHIIDFTERIGSAHGKFPAEIYQKAGEELKNTISSIPQKELPEGRPLTWFELVTLYAFLCFKSADVDYSVFEVGLGGRLDATNVIKPLISVINTIELEHTEFLGDTVEKIAAEKGGIIKEGLPVIVSRQKDSVMAVFEKIAEEKNARLYKIEDLINSVKSEYIPFNQDKNESSAAMKVNFDSPLFKRQIQTTLKMPGDFQAWNAALASCAVKIALPQITEEEIERGLSKAFLSGRFEIIKKHQADKNIPALILDGAHTVNSVNFTMQTFNKIFENQKAHLLFACAKDKDVEDIAPLFKDRFSKITLTRPGEVKQSDLYRTEKAFSKAGLSFDSNEDFKTAILQALKKAEEDSALLLVTGSFYLVSEVKKVIQPSM